MNYLLIAVIILVILNCCVAMVNHLCIPQIDMRQWFPAGADIVDGRHRLEGLRSKFNEPGKLPLYQPEEHYQHDIMYMEYPNERQRLREAVDRLFPTDKFKAGQTRLSPEGQFLPSMFEVDMEGISAEVMKKNTSYNYAKASGFVNRTVKDGYTDRVGYDI